MPIGTSGSVLVVIVGPPSPAGTTTDVTNYERAPSSRLTESSPCEQVHGFDLPALRIRWRMTHHSFLKSGPSSVCGRGGPRRMAKKQAGKGKRRVPKTVLRLPDLDQTKSAVLNSLSSIDAQRGYRHAIEEFIEWYCSEPRLSFSKTVVLRYRIHLESRRLAPGTINLRLGAVRRLAYEASDCGLLSPDLAAGIRRVRGVKKLGMRLGNWLTAEQGETLWQSPDIERRKGKRDRALLAVLLACGLRRHEAVELNFTHLQQREQHWAIVDLMGKAGHMRTIPMPGWVKAILDVWINDAGLTSGRVFRRVNRAGRVWGESMTEKVVWHVVREFAAKASIEKLAPHDLRRY